MRNVHVRTLTAVCAAGLLSACSGDSTGPSLPNIEGVYDLVAVYPVPSCTPESFASRLGVWTSPLTIPGKIRLRQSADSLTMENEGQAASDPRMALRGKLTPSGAFTLVRSFQGQRKTQDGEVLQREQTVNALGQFDLKGNPRSATISAAFKDVFREDVPNAPVLATCTYTGQWTVTHTGT